MTVAGVVATMSLGAGLVWLVTSVLRRAGSSEPPEDGPSAGAIG
jgi:hypothetical protein